MVHTLTASCLLLGDSGSETSHLVSDWNQTCCLLFKIPHLVLGLTDAQVLNVSAYKEFSKGQSDRQEVDLLMQDACKDTSGQSRGLCPKN